VELVIALVVLSFGVLGLAGTTLYMVRQVTLSRVTTERAAVYQHAIEKLRATPYGDLTDVEEDIGHFQYKAEVAQAGTNTTAMRIIVSGPGLDRVVAGALPTMSNSVTDTLNYTLIRP